MKLNIYWKEIGLAFLSSKGRFLSLFHLMLIGALTLVGLKVTVPNMERAAQAYLKQAKTMDLAVMSPLGLDKEDLAELQSIKGAQVEMGYFVDRSLQDTDKAIRVFSKPTAISLYQVETGRLPQKETEIALSTSLANQFAIGDVIYFSELDKEGHLLRANQFQIVGFVTSAEIWDKVTMGLASSGNGILTGYAVVEQSVFDSDVYTIARLSYDDLDLLAYYDATYQEKLTHYQQELDKLLEDNGQQRLERLYTVAEKEIAKGQDEIKQAQEQLERGQAQLENNQQHIKEGQDQLNDAQNHLHQNEQDLDLNRERLNSNLAELDKAKISLEQTLVQLEETKAFLDITKSDLEVMSEQLNQASIQLEEANNQLSLEGSQLSTAQANWYRGQQDLNQEIARIVQPDQTLSDYPELLAEQESLDAERASLDQALSSYNQKQEAYQADFDFYQEKEKQYQRKQTEYQTELEYYQASLEQYEANRTRYQKNLAAYEEGLAIYEAGEEQINASHHQLTEQENQLQEAQGQLNNAQSELDKKQELAEQEWKKAQITITQAQSDLTGIEEPTYRSYTRTTMPGGEGYTAYKNATVSIAAVGTIFPVVLYLVAALVTFTTMTRFVDEERTQAGLMKALGYTNRHIMRKFILYGLLAALSGSLVGIIAGHLFLSPMISSIITDTTVLGRTPLYFYPDWSLAAILFSLLAAVLPAYLVAKKELQERPASLLLPKPPVAGSRIVLEKITPIWTRMSFTQKVTARNIFRYKKRMLMTIFGVAGTIALLFGGLGIRSSISGVVESQFGDILRYDMIVMENSRAKESDKNKLASLLDKGEVAHSLPVAYQQIFQQVTPQETVSIGLLVMSETDISDFIQLRQAKTNHPISLNHQGVVLSKKLADLYGVGVGDRFSIQLSGKPVSLEVAAISQLYAGHFLYMTAPYFEKVTGQSYHANGYLVKLKDSSQEQVKNLASQLLKQKAVSLVIQHTSLIVMLETVAGALQSVMLILVVLSILLGLVILYNLTTINLDERIRELSTIKVLGFHTKEVTMYIYRETIMLSLIGIVLGLGAGIFFHKVLLEMIGSSTIIFNQKVTVEVYLIPLAILFGILVGLGYYVNHHLRKLDMLEALKSGD